jgi:hypothetical protein
MDLRTRLLEWMRGGSGDFAEMALEVFAYQFERNAAYRNYCVALGKTPETLPTWQEIPAVPSDAFKVPELAWRCFPESEITGFFLTSGTSTETKGKHEYRDLELYEASVLGALPPLEKPWFFSQRSHAAPHSSLVRMFEILDRDGKWLIDSEGRMACSDFLPRGATAVLGTSLALLRACEEMPAQKLADGSWIFETGGSKGLRDSFTPEQVRERLSSHFGVPQSRILNEYGMTELFSQCYKWGDQEAHHGPPWLAIRILDVHSGQPAALGQMGYLEIIDLANLDSVAAIRTQDFATAIGEREFILHGRDPAAIARGCSRGVDDVLNR